MNIYIVLIVLLLFPASSYAQVEKRNVLDKLFWLKTPIPTSSDCKIKISPKGIHTKKDFCTFEYSDSPILSNYKVKIVYFGKRKKWTKLTYQIIGSKKSVDIYLRGSSKRKLAESFDLVFSKDKFEQYGKLKLRTGDTKLRLFQSWGFPSAIKKIDKLEVYHYGLEFVGIIIGDMATVDVKNGKVITIGVIA